MRTRRAWLFAGIGFSVLALTVIGTVALAGETGLGLSWTTPQWTWGEEVVLQVDVDPMLVGGKASLMRQVEGHPPVPAGPFDITAPSFTISTPLPSEPHYAGLKISYWYDAIAPWGEPIGGSDTVRRKPRPPLDWD